MLFDSLPVDTPTNLRILVNFLNILLEPEDAADILRYVWCGLGEAAGRSVLEYLDCAVRRGLKFYSSPRAPRTFSGMSGVALARLLAGLAIRIRVLFLTSKSVAILCRSRMLYLK